MKTTKTLNTLVLAAALASVAGCRQNEQSAEGEREVTGTKVKQEFKEAASATGDYLADAKDEAVAAAQNQLRNIDARIAELADRSADYTDQAREKADAALAKLREQRDAAAKEMERLEAAGRDTWQDVKAGFDQAWSKLQETYEETRTSFTN